MYNILNQYFIVPTVRHSPVKVCDFTGVRSQNDDFRILIGSGRFIDTDFIVAESAIDILRILPNVSTQKHGDIVGNPVIHFANEDSINKNVGDSIDSNDVNAIRFADFAIIAEVEEFI